MSDRVLVFGSVVEPGTFNLVAKLREQPWVASVAVHAFDFDPAGERRLRRMRAQQDIAGLTFEDDLPRKPSRGVKAKDDSRWSDAEAVRFMDVGDRMLGSSGKVGVYYNPRPRYPDAARHAFIRERIAWWGERIDDFDLVICLDTRWVSTLAASYLTFQRGTGWYRPNPVRLPGLMAWTDRPQDWHPEIATHHREGTGQLVRLAEVRANLEHHGSLYAVQDGGAAVTSGLQNEFGGFLGRYVRRPWNLVVPRTYYHDTPLHQAVAELKRRRRARAAPKPAMAAPRVLPRPYTYLPLQALPEVNVQVFAPHLTDANVIIRRTHEELPDVNLLVRQHPVMAGVWTPLPHPSPRVIFETARDRPPMDALRNAQAVVGTNGTVSLEAAVMGIPVRNVGHPYYRTLFGVPEPTSWQVTEAEQAAAWRALRTDPVLVEPEQVEELIGAARSGSFPLVTWDEALRRLGEGRDNGVLAPARP